MTALYESWGKYAEAEQLCRQAFSAHKNPDKFEADMDTLYRLNKLADLCDKQSKYNEAEKFYKQAIVIAEKRWGTNSDGISPYLQYYSDFLRSRKRDVEADKLISRIGFLESHSSAGP